MINLTVKTLDSQNHPFSLENDQITVREFKEHIAETVAVSADSQRLIYCGRVLHDHVKLNDYDVNGKVVHLVQRAPPQSNQSANDRGQNQNQNNGPINWHHNPLRPQQFRLTRAQMQRNAMYLGAMAVPAGVVAEHGIPIPQISSSFSNSRLVAARHMLERAGRVMDRLENRRDNNTAPESNPPTLGQMMQVSEMDVEQPENDNRTNAQNAQLIETAVAAIAAALSTAGANNVTLLRGTSDDIPESRPVNESAEGTQSDAPCQQPQEQQQNQQQPQPPPPQQQGSTTTGDGQSNQQTPVVTRLSRLAEMLDMLLETQDRLRPHIERYRQIMQDDPVLPPGARVGVAQMYVSGVGECIHYMSHAFHSLSDVIVDMGQEPPRNLRCRPNIVWRNPGIQVEAHISVHGRNANNNNGNEENGDSGTPSMQAETSETNTESNAQPQEFACSSPFHTEQEQQPQSQSQQQQQQQQQPQPEPLFSTVLNLPHDVELLMEVAPDGNIVDAVSGDEQIPSSETNNNNNNNNNNGARVSATTGTLSWGSPNFLRDLMQTVAGHMIQRGTATVIQQTVAPGDSGNTNAGQSTQARSNVDTHPTTATRTRSTSRPHSFRHPIMQPIGGGMSLGPFFDFDPFLPCQSHHVRQTSSFTSSPVTSPSQGMQTNQTNTAETQTQPQTATTTSATSNTSSINTTAPTTPLASDAHANLLRSLIRVTSTPDYPNPTMAANLSALLQLYTSGILPADPPDASPITLSPDNPLRDVLLANLLERRGVPMSTFTTQVSEPAEIFLGNLFVLVVRNMTLEGLLRIRDGESEPLANLRRPLQEYFRQSFPYAPTETLEKQVLERLLLLIRQHFETLSNEVDENIRNNSRIDFCATIVALFGRHIKNILHHLFNSEIDDASFGQEFLNILHNMGEQFISVLRYYVGGVRRRLGEMSMHLAEHMLEGLSPSLRRLPANMFILQFGLYASRIPQPPESEILPLLIYKEGPPPSTNVPPASTHQSQSQVEPMETESVEVRTTLEATPLPEDGDDIPGTFPGHEVLPSDWVPIIARDGVRQRRQLQVQGITNGGVGFSDAYLGTLPTKRRKLIEQQKPRLLVSPTPNHSAIAASMERLVREGAIRAGVEENEGAAVAVALDPGVRRAFGQAIRDCLNPNRCSTPDFPDPLRFPKATKYFADQNRTPK